MRQQAVALYSKTLPVLTRESLGSQVACDLQRVVGAAAVEHDHLVSKRSTFDAAANEPGFVFGQDANAQAGREGRIALHGQSGVDGFGASAFTMPWGVQALPDRRTDFM